MSEQAPRIYRWLGGRKNANGLLFASLLTVAYYWLDSHDGSGLNIYAMWLAVDLLGTSGLHVFEDVLKAKGGTT